MARERSGLFINEHLPLVAVAGEGVAAWVRFKEAYPLPKVAEVCKARGLYLSNGLGYNPPGQNYNACRMGFASLTETEMQQACHILREVLEALKKQ